jgi:hypothetical protein
MSLKLVPFNPVWISHDKIDIHAIYRRPRFVQDTFGEWVREYDANGLPTWDLTGPLPVKQHVRWESKGFEYVTLANRESLAVAAKMGTLVGGSYRDYDQHQTGGPWSFRKYHEGQQQAQTAEIDQIREAVAKYGPEVYEDIRRTTEPGFRLPDELKRKARATSEPVNDVAAQPVYVPVGQPPKRRGGRPRKVRPVSEEQPA